MARVVMYCTAVCPYCIHAERLLHSKGATGIEKIRIDLRPDLREAMEARSGCRTVPQIYIGERHIGGFDELAALDRAGGLLPLLTE